MDKEPKASPVDGASWIGMAKVGTCTVLTPREPLTHLNCDKLEELLQEFIQKNKIQIVLDLKLVPFLDSKALELLLAVHEQLHELAGGLKIIGLNELCRDILLSTRLIHVFHLYDDLHQAIVDRR